MKKERKNLYIFLIVLLLAIIFSVWLYILNLNRQINDKNNDINSKQSKINEDEVKIYNYDNNIVKISYNPLNEYLFTDKTVDLQYEGGPVHWGSRSINIKDITETDYTKTINLNVTDESDLKGEDPKKQWNEKWYLTSNGLYIDGFLMIKLPLNVGTSWTIEGYKPIATIDDVKHKANIEITNISKVMGKDTKLIKQITTVLTIDDITMVGDRKYTETTIYEAGSGVIKKTVTEPTINDFNLEYWLDSKKAKS